MSLVYFAKLKIGDTFHDGVSKNGSDQDMVIIYKKVSKSAGEGIEQHGYRNQRAVGGIYKFAPFRQVILVN